VEIYVTGRSLNFRNDTDFHQFMLYTPIPGTPLYEEHRKNGSLLPEEEVACADTHGQLRFNYRHKHIPRGAEAEILLRSFNRDFRLNGPSIARMIRTTLQGWQRYKEHASERIRSRYRWEARNLATTFAGVIWAMKKWYRQDRPMKKKINTIFHDLCREFGWKTQLIANLIGRVEYFTMKREAKRLAKGWTREPATFYEKNRSAMALWNKRRSSRNSVKIVPASWVACS